jgi:hypothetical protein
MLSPGDVDDAMCWFSCDTIIFCNGFMLPKTKMLAGLENQHFIFCSEIYGSQTKILERGTKDEMRIFEAVFNGSWPKVSTHALEKCFENPHFIFCSSFQNLRLGAINFMLPKRRFWKVERAVR